MPIGDIVMVRTFLNQPIVRRVLNEDGKTVKICREKVFFALNQEKGAKCRGTAVSRDNVFKWDKTLLEEMVKFDKELDSKPVELTILWKKAVPYCGEGNLKLREMKSFQLNKTRNQ